MLYILDYGAGNVTSLANSVRSLGHDFKWIETVEDFEKADRILFPGVGAFGSALASLRLKGFAEPLKAYIRSGRPYMGICIGMQALFTSSDESKEPGLGVFTAHVGRFREGKGKQKKSVPCIGWNGAVPIRAENAGAEYGFEGDNSYYFVHSYRVEYDGKEDLKDFTFTVTQYGDETYISSIQKGNIFATQFHPEKSGKAGLRVLRAWLDHSLSGFQNPMTLKADVEINRNLADNGFTKRIVACLDVRSNDAGDLVVTKGDQYDVREAEVDVQDSAISNGNGLEPSEPSTKRPRDVRNLGKPVDLARRYYAEGADEIAFLNITSFRSCPLHDQPMLDVVRQSAETIFVPLTIGGGIKDTVDPDGTRRSALEVAGSYFRCGADKVSIGSDAVFAVEELIANKGKKTGLTGIETISYGYGAQAVVVSVDPRRVYATSLEGIPVEHRPSAVDLAGPITSSSSQQFDISADLGPNGERYCWYQCTVRGGREDRDLDVVQLGQGVEALGAGEILLNSVDRDGSKSGFDLRLVNLLKTNVTIPVIASSGAGKVQDFEEVFNKTDTEAALAAGIFHRKEVSLEEVRQYLTTSQSRIHVRKV